MVEATCSCGKRFERLEGESDQFAGLCSACIIAVRKVNPVMSKSVLKRLAVTMPTQDNAEDLRVE